MARLVAERPKAHPGGPGRTPFQRDRARVLHASALRRLAGKTQVVGAGEDDFPRTRLTHSLECAQVGREMALALGADADLVDAACLAHDLGHPPFGHTGEQALAALADAAGGFEGNAQSLRLLTRLEVKVPGGGLNLTRATLDAACKYPWPRREGESKFGVYDDDLLAFGWLRQGAPGDRRCVEAQIMDWADDVAYSVHDVEDGLHARQVDPAGLDALVLAELAIAEYLPGADAGELAGIWTTLVAAPWWVSSYAGTAADQARLKNMTSELIGRFSTAALEATRAAHGPGPLTRYAADLVVPWQVRAESALLKVVAVQEVMRRPQRVALQATQRTLLTELVEAVLARGPDALDPLLWPAWEQAAGDAQRLRVALDQVASLTDASAVSWHRRLVAGG